MAKVTLYIKNNCPFCAKAQALLERRGAELEVINAGSNDALRAEMVARANGRTSFPQIFVGVTHIGGCDDLHALEETGGLDSLLNGAER